MKLAITSSEEISALNSLCAEIEDFSKELNRYNYEDIDLETEENKGHYTLLYPLWKKAHGSIEDFMASIFTQFDVIHFRRILWNCDVLLNNCADLTLDTLDFNPEIKAGQEALSLLNELQSNIDYDLLDKEYLQIKIKAILDKIPATAADETETQTNS